jgi:hypothetical protein
MQSIHPSGFFHGYNETSEKCSILFKFKAGENFNHRNTLSILRIALMLHCVPKFEPNAEIGPKGAFCKGLIMAHRSVK